MRRSGRRRADQGCYLGGCLLGWPTARLGRSKENAEYFLGSSLPAVPTPTFASTCSFFRTLISGTLTLYLFSFACSELFYVSLLRISAQSCRLLSTRLHNSRLLSKKTACCAAWPHGKVDASERELQERRDQVYRKVRLSARVGCTALIHSWELSIPDFCL